MRLRYELSRRDVLVAMLGVQFYLRGNYLIAVLVLPVMWWYLFQFVEGLTGSDTVVRVIFATLVTLVGGVGSLGVMLMLPVVLFNLWARSGVIGEHTLELTDEGLVESTDVNRTLRNWDTPFRVRTTPGFTHLEVGGGHVYPIPTGRPPIEGSVPAFLDELSARVRRSGEGGQAGPPAP
jgi:hypothetical protein